MERTRLWAWIVLSTVSLALHANIDRSALLNRNNPQVQSFDSLSALTVGNGGFAMTVDATGLQTFPAHYDKGVPLGTQSDWGWHSFPNPKNYQPDELLRTFDFNHRSHEEPYLYQFEEPGRQHDATEWLRGNPHRLHLGIIGFALPAVITLDDFTDIQQELILRKGIIVSSYKLQGIPVSVRTTCHPTRDMISAHITSAQPLPIKILFPYPTGGHTDGACSWNDDSRHTSSIISMRKNLAVFEHVIDACSYYVIFQWKGNAYVSHHGVNSYVITPSEGNFEFTCEFLPKYEHSFHDSFSLPGFQEVAEASAAHWADFWNKGGMVDFSSCSDPRAPELERRVVLSQYLMAVNCAGDTPPQETGLTYNSEYGKFRLESMWWHQSHFPLWGHAELLDHTLEWYEKAEQAARQIAERQCFDGVRWMGTTDPSAAESPSSVGNFLIWQQPQFIYLAELVYRAQPSEEVLHKYFKLVQATAEFMCSFTSYNEEDERYMLHGFIPAQETMTVSQAVNSPFELASWLYALSTAQHWRERLGMRRKAEWDDVIEKLSPLAQNNDGMYLASETAFMSYFNIQYLSGHPAVLGAIGMYPSSCLVDNGIMQNTLNHIWNSWWWNTCCGWDFPLTAMCAARLGDTHKAVEALLMDNVKNTFLPNGHNYQDNQLRIYLPGNGGLLTAIAMMCAGWDGAPKIPNPGFPQDGTWNVHWEGLLPLP